MLLTSLAFVTTASRAAAAPPSLDVAQGVAGCPSEKDLRSTIAGHLGRDDFDRPDAPRVAIGVRRGEGNTLVADVTVTMHGASSQTRTLEGRGESCAELVRAAGLSAALAIEEEAPEPAIEPTSKPIDTATPPKNVAPPERAAPSHAPAPSPAGEDSGAPLRSLRRDRAVVVASGLTTLGLLPQPATGLGLSARLRVSDVVWLSARGMWLPDTRTPNGTFAMNLLAGGAGACAEPLASGHVALVGCAHVLAGQLQVVDPSVLMASGDRFMGAASLSAAARFRVVGPLTAEAGAEAVVPFNHPTFLTAECPPTGFQQPFAALALAIGVGVSIP